MSLTFSNADRWLFCPASVNVASVGHGSGRGTDEQIEGRAAAWVAALVLDGHASEAIELIDRVSPDGWVVTADMARHVQGYVDLVRQFGAVRSVEKDLSLFNGLVNGRPDSHTVTDDRFLHVFELKYGYRVIEPYDNPQLLLGARALITDELYIRVHIYQPRAYHPAGRHRSHVLSRSELEAFTVQAFQAVNATISEPHRAVPGEQCTYCPRRTSCATLQNDIAAMVEVVSVPEDHTRQLTPDELYQRYKMLMKASKLIKAALSGVNGEVESRLKRREFLPQFYMDEQRSRDRQWTLTPQQMGERFGFAAYKTVLKSPVEMEREGFEVDDISHRPYTGQTVKEWNSNDLKRWFKD